MQVAVTGATGFLGEVLVKELAAQGFSVVCLTRGEARNSERTIKWRQINYEDPESIGQALQGCSTVVHLAGIAHSKAAAGEMLRYEKGICHATESILNGAVSAGVKTFIFASSIKVYGEKSRGTAFTESDVPQPASIYGLAKLKAEKLVQARKGDINAVIFRFPPMFGSAMKGSVKYIFKAAKFHAPLPIHSFEHRRHFLYVKNASALIVASIQGKIRAGLYNVYDPIGWKLGDFYREVYAAVRGKPLPWYLFWTMPIFLEILLRRTTGLAPLMLPFELKSNSFQEWSHLLAYTPQESIRDAAKSYLDRS